MDLVNLKQINQAKVKDFSLGMKQRLGIARAIITKPELLILDEPINGLDPVGIKEIRDLFRMLSTEYGITILISSHILAEIEQIADTIGVINQGKLIKEVSMDEIQDKNTSYIELVVKDTKKAAFILSHKLNVNNIRVLDDHNIRIYDEIAQSELSKVLVMNDVEIEAIHKKSSSLEDYFLSLLHGGDISA
ncbi:putative ABC transporter ATP-binding protein YxlF [compost metagenome]